MDWVLAVRTQPLAAIYRGGQPFSWQGRVALVPAPAGRWNGWPATGADAQSAAPSAVSVLSNAHKSGHLAFTSGRTPVLARKRSATGSL